MVWTCVDRKKKKKKMKKEIASFLHRLHLLLLENTVFTVYSLPYCFAVIFLTLIQIKQILILHKYNQSEYKLQFFNDCFIHQGKKMQYLG